jgi:hypothetical protein
MSGARAGPGAAVMGLGATGGRGGMAGPGGLRGARGPADQDGAKRKGGGARPAQAPLSRPSRPMRSGGRAANSRRGRTGAAYRAHIGAKIDHGAIHTPNACVREGKEGGHAAVTAHRHAAVFSPRVRRNRLP